MAILIGLVLVSLLGLFHHYGLLAVRALKPNADKRPQAAIIATFVGLVVLHTIEIVAFAGAYSLLLNWGGIGSLGENYDTSWEGLLYFSGINFTTLGYTQIETSGSIRIINMMQSLGGFMVLTWSATFLYAVSERAWRE